jgi:hypothetical protein
MAKFHRKDENMLQKASDVPIIGPWLGRVGRVMQIMSVPCSPTPEIWIRAFWHATPTMLWTFVKPSPTDYVAERLGRTKKKWKLSFFPEAGQNIVPKGKIAWAAFSGITLLRRIGWYFTAADAVTGGLVNWVSTAYRWQGCVTPAGTMAQGTALEHGVPATLPAGDYLMDLWHFTQAVNCSTGPSGVAVPNNVKASVTWLLEQEKSNFGSLPDCSFTTRLVRNRSELIGAEGTQGLNADGLTSSSGVYLNGHGFNRAVNQATSGGTYEIVITKDFGVLQIKNGRFSLTGSPLNDSVTPDP